MLVYCACRERSRARGPLAFREQNKPHREEACPFKLSGSPVTKSNKPTELTLKIRIRQRPSRNSN